MDNLQATVLIGSGDFVLKLGGFKYQRDLIYNPFGSHSTRGEYSVGYMRQRGSWFAFEHIRRVGRLVRKEALIY